MHLQLDSFSRTKRHISVVNKNIHIIEWLVAFLLVHPPSKAIVIKKWIVQFMVNTICGKTNLPITYLSLISRWFFAMISISGAFAVTWSIVFAYVADITEEENRSSAYGLVYFFPYLIYKVVDVDL